MRAVTLASHARTPVLVKSFGFRRKYIEPINDSANRAPLHEAREKVDLIPYKPFYILLAIVLNKPVHVPKRMTVVHVMNNPALFIATEATILGTGIEIIGAVQYKPSVDRDTLKTRHEDVEAKQGYNSELNHKVRSNCKMSSRNTASDF